MEFSDELKEKGKEGLTEGKEILTERLTEGKEILTERKEILTERLTEGKEILTERLTEGKEIAYALKNRAWNEIQSLGDKMMPTLKISGIKDGKLTPEEFIKAGDNLVGRFGSWKWCGAISRSQGKRSYLPDDKQYLITLQVPCEKRANDLEHVKLNDEGEWRSIKYEEVKDEPVFIKSKKKDSFLDEDYGFEDLEEAEDLAAIQGGDFVMCRRYNIYITYDNFYRTPRVWLSGTSEFGIPMNYNEIFEDIVSEYRNRTVTLEKFPYSGDVMVSIHPCKHAETMKHFIEKMEIKTQDYMITFLKFISSVLPTMNYDFTI